jgi:hypothetical protein
MNNPCIRAFLPRFAAALALTASVASAGITNRLNNFTFNTSPVTFWTGYAHYVDWSATNTLGHSTYNTMSFNGSTPKYFDYTSYAFSGGNSRCYKLNTRSTVPVSTSADTEILIKNSNGIWVKVADDIQGTYAEANFWFTAGGNTRSDPKIRVIAYHSGHNSEAFMFESVWYTNDFIACVDGLPNETDPAAAIVDGNGIASVYRAR